MVSKIDTQLQKVGCPLCESEHQQQLFKTYDRLDPISNHEFQIARCKECGFTFLNPRPGSETMAGYYERENYDPFLSSSGTGGLWNGLYKIARSFMLGNKRRRIQKYIKTGKLLDIGCGTGEFLWEMQAHGWDVVGLETDHRAADFARDKYGLRIYQRNLVECHFANSLFDVITTWHVLEHLFNPLESLKKISEILTRDGMLFIAAPNINSFDAAFYKSEWVALDAPRHLLHFTPGSIRKMLKIAGMEVVARKQMPLDAIYNCLMSEKLVWSKGRRSGMILPLYLFRGVIVALFTITRAFVDNEGSSVLYFAQKSETMS